jgi:hypothetical protein
MLRYLDHVFVLKNTSGRSHNFDGEMENAVRAHFTNFWRHVRTARRWRCDGGYKGSIARFS